MRLKKNFILVATALCLTIGSSLTTWAAGATVSSSTQMATNQNDPTEQVSVNGASTSVWSFSKSDDLIFTQMDIPYSSYQNAMIYIYYPKTDGNFTINSLQYGLLDDFAFGVDADGYIDLIGADINKSFPLYQTIQNSGQLNGYQPEDCLYSISIRYDDAETKRDSYWVYRFIKFSRDNSVVNTTDTTNSAGTWASNDKGWWIQYADGTYLTNAWYQSPTSGLWYYMGADGYMLTNTTTPDGCKVNADGVWVQ